MLSRRLAPYVLAEAWLLAGTLASMFALSVATVARPWPMTFIVDSVLGGRAPPGWVLRFTGEASRNQLLIWAVVAIVLTLVIAQSLALAQTYLSQLLGQRLVLALRCDLYAKLQHLSLRFHDHRSVGDLIYRITGDAAALQDIVTHGILPVVIQAITLSLVGVTIYVLDPRLALVSLAVIPFLLANTVFFSDRVKRRSRGLAHADSGLYTRLSEVLSSIRAVKAFAAEDLEVNRFVTDARASKRAYVRIITLSTLGGLINDLVSGLAMAAVVLVGALIVMRGELTLGELLVFVAYLGTLQAAATSVAQCALVIQKSRASAERVVEILAEVDERTDGGTGILARVRGRLGFDEISFGYDAPGGHERPGVLHDFSLDIAAGETVALVGRSGAGKTTVLSLLLGFYRPDKGRVLLDGEDIQALDLKWLRRNVALVLQDPIIFSASIGENIGYGRPGASHDEIEAAARAAGLHDFIASRPHGYKAKVGERGARLSGGQRQRIGIARAFLKDAPILVLDEPTSNLDARTEREVFEALERLAAGRTTIIVAHRLATARRADRIVVLDHGRVAEAGAHEALLSHDGLYAELWRDQGGAGPKLVLPASHG